MSVLSFTSNTAKRKKIIEDLGPMPSSVTFPTYTTDLYYQTKTRENSLSEEFNLPGYIDNNYT